MAASAKQSSRFNANIVLCEDLVKPDGPILTGIGFLDHMVDQFNSHAQIGTIMTIADFADDDNAAASDVKDRNRHANHQQDKLMSLVGSKLGTEFKRLLDESPHTGTTSRFCCPLDEALVVCTLQRVSGSGPGKLTSYKLAPFGKYPAAGRKYLGTMETDKLEYFWSSLAEHACLDITLAKVRGDNAHHIVESSFKAASRALRNMLDGTNTMADNPRLAEMYGPDSPNWAEGVAQGRQGTVTRKTKETSISATAKFDGGVAGVQVATGNAVLNDFFTSMATNAAMSLTIECNGDLWIDEHHTSEDVSIAVGQVLNQAFGTKAGMNRMWCAAAVHGDSQVEVTMDLSNRPCLTHNLHLDNGEEKVGDLSMEMLEHVLDSLVCQSHMTVHIVQLEPNSNIKDTVDAVAIAFGQALKYCSMVDGRRSGATASSKGTLSV
jgi:imidazoleglycerol-phosphate dehydratase